MRELSVIGLGKLGFPLACVLARHYKVIAIDKVFRKIEETDLDKWLEKYGHNIKFTKSFKDLGELTFVIVPTPSQPDNSFSSQYVEEVLDKIKTNQIVVIVSTLFPGETDRLQKKYPRLTLIYSPTFVALGNVIFNLTFAEFFLVGAKTKKGLELLEKIYRKISIEAPYICPSFEVLTPLEAEITKLALNCYITTKITFANQIGNLCYRLKIKPDRILEIIGSDSRVGKKYLRAGLGYGGCCFPRDNLALSAFFRKNAYSPGLFELIHELNELQTTEFICRIQDLNPKSIGIKSLSFKEGTKNTECSQLKEIYDYFKKKNYKIKIGKGDVNLDWWGICLK